MENEELRIGVFVCECGVNIGGYVDVQAVADYAMTLPNVEYVKINKFTCADSGQAEIQIGIKEHNLNRVIVAACTPRTHEPTFRACCKEAGVNPYQFEFVNIRDQCSWIHMWDREGATAKAKDLVRMGIARSMLLEPLEESSVPVDQNVLVIGAGVAGMQAAIDFGDMGYNVYLVEKEPSIGGRMARFDKVFPTNDCSICILGPKMVEVARNKNINIMSYSEVTDVEGFVGNFEVTVLHKPRYLDTDICTGCGACQEVCPVELPSEFNENFGIRKAIYIPFPQAVPMRAVLDMENCISCKACEKACEAGAIRYDQEAIYEKLKVGVITVAVGMDAFDPLPHNNYGYGLYDNVITTMEFERLLNAAGPTGGHVVRPSDAVEPITVGFINCVGSRDVNENIYCSGGVCCMFSIKNAQLLKEKRPETNHFVFYMDIRATMRGFEEAYNRARDLGVKFIRGKPVEITEMENGNLVVRAEDTLKGEIVNVEVDLLVLGTGLVPNQGIRDMGSILKLPRSADGFLTELHPKLAPVDTTTDGVFVAGCAAGPRDVAYATAHGSATAGRATRLLIVGTAPIMGITARIDEDACVVCGVCVDKCPYGVFEIVGTNGDRRVNVVEALCKGCGTCVTACPTGALEQSHFKNDQILAQVRNVLVYGGE